MWMLAFLYYSIFFLSYIKSMQRNTLGKWSCFNIFCLIFVHMVVGFTTTCAITTKAASLNPARASVNSIQKKCDQVCQCLVADQWFSPGTPVSSTNKTDCLDVTEILLKVAVSILTLTLVQNKAQLGTNYQLVKYFNCCSDIIKKGINICFLRKVKIVEWNKLSFLWWFVCQLLDHLIWGQVSSCNQCPYVCVRH